MDKTNRRTFIKNGLLGGTLSLITNSVHANSKDSKKATPSETEGPFYPLLAQKDRDFDLTKIEGKQGSALGKRIIVQGQIQDTQGKPVEDATIDVWHANAAGRYRHPHDTNPAPLDPNFQGWAIVQSGKDGRYRFITVYPGPYPATKTWIRPPHIHFKISKKGYIEITTQMYFPEHELNNSDRLLQRKNAHERQLMISNKVQDNPEIYEFNIVLETG